VTKDERKKQRRKADRARREADKRAEYLAARQRREQARGRVSSVLLTGDRQFQTSHGIDNTAPGDHDCPHLSHKMVASLTQLAVIEKHTEAFSPDREPPSISLH